jgi:hypothetical protein
MKRISSLRALDQVIAALQAQRARHRKTRMRYAVPSLWTGKRGPVKAVRVDPFAFYLGVLRGIKRSTAPRRPRKPTGGEWTREAVVYNLFVRTTTAFDHDRNGKLDLDAPFFRETGTFLKAMALLPYIKRLGATTVHLLPITSIGHDGNKGSLGSPYAIRNPYELDERLGEPVLGLDVKTQFKAFVEAAHRLGMRVVVEFVFRTAAKDGDWVKEHPEWFYWIRNELLGRDAAHQDEGRYGSPLFTREELERIHADVRAGHLGNLLPPHEVYRKFFTAPPAPEAIEKVDGKWIGTLPDGQRVRIPGAFADWPPDDNQPPWGDVTYLRMYTHPDFNYIGYNTIRMYDTRLTRPEHINRPLWDRIVGIVPYYQKEFRIDGVMIDMGHALPMELKAEMVRVARANDRDFAFWDENFSITARSREEGYNAVFGYLWVDEHHPERMKKFLERLASEGFPIPYFGTPENHNTPRASARPGGTAYARWAAAVNAFLPAVPFIHSGYELAERQPINTGLDFTPEQIAQLPSEHLPLFSAYAYDWLSKEAFTDHLRTLLAIRAKHLPLIADDTPASFRVLAPDHPSVLAYARLGAKQRRRIAVVANADFTGAVTCAVPLETTAKHVADLLGGGTLPVHNGAVTLKLGPGACAVFEF